MSGFVAFLRSLGVDGAARNARLLLDQRRHEHLAVDGLSAAAVAPADSRRASPP